MTNTTEAALRDARQRLNEYEQMQDAQAQCVPCKLCGGKAIITDAGPGAGYYIKCGNHVNFRSSPGCMIDGCRLGGWAYNVMDWWNRLHSQPSPASSTAQEVGALFGTPIGESIVDYATEVRKIVSVHRSLVRVAKAAQDLSAEICEDSPDTPQPQLKELHAALDRWEARSSLSPSSGEPVKRIEDGHADTEGEAAEAWAHLNCPTCGGSGHIEDAHGKVSGEPASVAVEADVERLFWKWWNSERREGEHHAASFHAGYRAALSKPTPVEAGQDLDASLRDRAGRASPQAPTGLGHAATIPSAEKDA